MTDEVHQARVEAIWTELGRVFGSLSALDHRKIAQRIIAADPVTAQLTCVSAEAAFVHVQLAAANAEIAALRSDKERILEVLRKADAQLAEAKEALQDASELLLQGGTKKTAIGYLDDTLQRLDGNDG